VLDDSILARMIRYDRQHAVRRKAVPECWQRSLERVNLCIDSDPDGLEEAGELAAA